jgi:hypothetical protein
MVQARGTIFAQEAVLPIRTKHIAAPEPDPLVALVRDADKPLYVTQTVFPFVLFTDKVIIRANHLDVVIGVFFWSAISTRVQISDIRQVTLEFNPFFATLEIVPQGPTEQTLRVAFLWKHQAQKARRIIAGLMEAQRNNVDVSKYKNGEFIYAMELLGKAKE